MSLFKLNTLIECLSVVAKYYTIVGETHVYASEDCIEFFFYFF